MNTFNVTKIEKNVTRPGFDELFFLVKFELKQASFEDFKVNIWVDNSVAFIDVVPMAKSILVHRLESLVNDLKLGSI